MQEDKLPYLGTSYGGGSVPVRSHSWAVELLPFLDGAGIFERIVGYTGTDPDGPFPAGQYPFRAVLACPSSGVADRHGSGLSYVANAGYIRGELWADSPDHHAEQINWDRSCPCDGPLLSQSDRIYAYATGVFWRKLPDDNYQQRLSLIASGDGLANTFMISENLQAGPYDSDHTGRIGFGISVSVMPTLAPYHVSQANQGECCPNPPPCTRNCAPAEVSDLVLLPTFAAHDQENDNDARINANAGGELGRHPRPSSSHPRGVNMLWCDGRVTFVNQDIDEFVYARLITVAGGRHGQAIDGAID